MKSYRKELWFNVPSRRAFINITPEVKACVRDSGIVEVVFINDDESGLHQDYETWLEQLAHTNP